MADDPVTPPAAPAETPPAPVTPPPAPTQTDAPWHTSIFNPDGTFVDGYQSKLPDDFAEDRALLANFKDFKGLTKSLKENMTQARAKPPGLVIPPADAPPEEQAKYQAELKKLYGVPESADAYKLALPENAPAGLELTPESVKEFQGLAHQIGLTEAQANELLKFDIGRLSSTQQMMETQRTQEMEQIQAGERAEMAKRWGDKVDENLTLAARLAVKQNIPQAKDLFDPKHPMFVGVDIADAFASLARQVGEKHLPTGASINNMNPETMANDIINNPSNPEHAAFMNSDHPQSAAVRAKVSELFKQVSAQATA